MGAACSRAGVGKGPQWTLLEVGAAQPGPLGLERLGVGPPVAYGWEQTEVWA